MRVQYELLARGTFRLWSFGIRWTVILCVMMWFFMSPLTPLFSLLSPWVRAEEKLRQEGLTGFPLVIGGGSESERRYDSSGEYWRKEEQSTYLVLPDSFRRFEVYTYSEVEGSGITGAQVTLLRSSLLAPLVIWLLAGTFTAWQIRLWLLKKKPNFEGSAAPERAAGPRLNKPVSSEN